MNRNRVNPFIVGTSLLISAGILVGSAAVVPTWLHSNATAQERAIVPPRDLQTAVDLSTAFRKVAEFAEPSVVSIATVTKPKQLRRRGGSNQQQIPPQFRPFFPEFFGEDDSDFRQTPGNSGLGSGVIVRADGYILTNNHVVESADELTVGFSDGREFRGEVVGADPRTDLAVVKIDAKNLIAAPIGDSDAMQVGDWVVAVGSPFGLEQTVTAGIISAKHRSRGIVADGKGYEDFLQTDAAINPGNSGGPLLNLRGEIIGINTAIESRSGGFNGIGFAVPSAMAGPVVESIIRDGKVRRGMLGAKVGNITSEAAAKLGVPANFGVFIDGVLPGQPADKGGLQANDIVTEANGRKVADATLFRNWVASNPPGAKVELKVRRGEKIVDVTVVLGELTDAAEADFSLDGAVVPELGIRVKPLDKQVAQQLGINSDQSGLVVVEVDRNGVATKANLEPGDVIFQVGKEPVTDAAKLSKAIEKNRQDGLPTLLKILGASGGKLIQIQ